MHELKACNELGVNLVWSWYFNRVALQGIAMIAKQ